MATNSDDKWASIPQFPKAQYEVDIMWGHIERNLEWLGGGCGLELDPDFQRAHVWTEDQQRAYVEYVLQGGEVGRNITWNANAWPSPTGPVQLVDGKQRLEAARKFIRGDLEVFGGLRFETGDSLRITQGRFRFRVCCLDRQGVLRLYLNINGGGTPHTADELARVRALLEVA